MRSTLNLHGCIFCISPEPDLKWAQDPKKIYLTIGMKCNSAEENHPVLTEDTISFSCKDKAGKERYVSILACQKNLTFVFSKLIY